MRTLTKLLAGLASAALLVTVAFFSMGVTYLVPYDDPVDGFYMSGRWKYNPRLNPQWYTNGAWDTLPDTAAIVTCKADTNGPVQMESNYWFVYWLTCGDTLAYTGAAADSVNAYLCLDVSWDGIYWTPADSTSYKGNPTFPYLKYDTLFGYIGAYARLRTYSVCASASRDTFFSRAKIYEPNGPVW
jgi:hypothetical protein